MPIFEDKPKPKYKRSDETESAVEQENILDNGPVSTEATEKEVETKTRVAKESTPVVIEKVSGKKRNKLSIGSKTKQAYDRFAI